MEATETARREEIRKALGRLVTKGVQPYWVMEVGRPLLGLAAVRERLDLEDLNDPEAEAAAVVAVLRKATDRLSGSQRVLLTIVLGLDRDFLGRTAHERRMIAGRVFRGDEGAVMPGTIRQLYEPEALDRLAEVLWSDEERQTQSADLLASTRIPSPQPPSSARGECVLWLEGGDRVDGIVGSVEEVRSEIDRVLDDEGRWVEFQRRSDADVHVLAIRAKTIIGITAPE